MTIVPDAALGRYLTRKQLKYAPLCRAVAARHATFADAAAADPAADPATKADPDAAHDDLDASAAAASALATMASLAAPLRCPPPIVIAVGTSGALHPTSARTLREVRSSVAQL